MKSLLVLVSIFLYAQTVCADVVYLKNGRSMEGLIVSEKNDVVELEVSRGSVKFPKSTIIRIERGSADDAALLRQGWQAKKEAAEKHAQERRSQESKSKETKFSKDSKSISVNAKLNGTLDVKLVLDTGASIVMLKKDITDKLGMNLKGVHPDMKLQVADGRFVNARHIVLSSVIVQGSEVNNVEAAVLLDDAGDSRFGDGLLGMSFLQRFNFKVDHQAQKLILEKIK